MRLEFVSISNMSIKSIDTTATPTALAKLLFMTAFSPQYYIGLYEHFPWNILHFKANIRWG